MSLQIFKIKNTKEDLDLAFNIYVSEEWLNREQLEPYDLLIVESETEKIPLAVIVSSLLRGTQCVISNTAAQLLSVTEGDLLKYSKEMLTQVQRVIIEKVSSPEEEPGPAVLPKDVIEFFSRKLRFIGLKNNVELRCAGRLYCLKLVSPGLNLRYGIISAATKFHVTRDFLAKIERIIGLDETVERIREVLMWPAIFPDYFKKLKLDQPKGVLLVGVPGVGKTHLVKQLAKSTGYQFFYIRGPEFISKFYGASEKNLRMLFDAAVKAAPAIIFFDEIDSIASKRTDAGEPERRLVSQLLTCMEQTAGKSVIVFGATNHVEFLDPALRRPGRFDLEFTLKPPDVNARAQMIKLFSDSSQLSDADAQFVAEKTDGFVGADLNMLSKEAKLNVIRRQLEAEQHDPNKLVLTRADYEFALLKVRPSLLRGYNTKTNVKLEDIRGYDALKKKVLTQITHPVIYSSFYKQSALKKIKGILFYGAPGTGKTSLAQAIANELGYNFIGLSASELRNKYVGETEASIRDLFSKARYASPCVVFIDEFESLSRDRSADDARMSTHDTSVVGQLLSEMDGLTVNDEVIVIGATNEPKLIDKAFLRPGRFDLLLEVPLPTSAECLEILNFYLSKVQKGETLDLATLNNFASKFRTNGFTGADIQAIVRTGMSQCIARCSPSYLAEKHHNNEALTLEAIDIERSYQQHLTQRKIKNAFKDASALV